MSAALLLGVSLLSSLVALGSVMGQPFSVPSPFSGNGEWGVDVRPRRRSRVSGRELRRVGQLALGGAARRHTADGVELLPLIDPDVSSPVDCVGDVLALQGDGAPLVGNFVCGDSPDGATPVGSTP